MATENIQEVPQGVEQGDVGLAESAEQRSPDRPAKYKGGEVEAPGPVPEAAIELVPVENLTVGHLSRIADMDNPHSFARQKLAELAKESKDRAERFPGLQPTISAEYLANLFTQVMERVNTEFAHFPIAKVNANVVVRDKILAIAKELAQPGNGYDQIDEERAKEAGRALGKSLQAQTVKYMEEQGYRLASPSGITGVVRRIWNNKERLGKEQKWQAQLQMLQTLATTGDVASFLNRKIIPLEQDGDNLQPGAEVGFDYFVTSILEYEVDRELVKYANSKSKNASTERDSAPTYILRLIDMLSQGFGDISNMNHAESDAQINDGSTVLYGDWEAGRKYGKAVSAIPIRRP